MISLKQVNPQLYVGEGHSFQRETGETPNGNEFGGRWVLRYEGEYVDHDAYRHDLAERHNIKLTHQEVVVRRLK